jgi:copper chaperone CopZ
MVWEVRVETLAFFVDGMSCGHCVARVARTLAALPGVDVRHVVIGRAEVAVDSGKVSSGQIASALEDAGYPARIESAGAR